MSSVTALEVSTAQGRTGAGCILVIDDNHDFADMLEMLLSGLGYVVRTAYGGVTGLALADAFKPDVILCDLGMPGVDGYEVARTVRGRSYLGKTALVAVSAWDDPATLARIATAGFDSHLVKPVQYECLRALLQTHLSQRTVSDVV